MYFFIERNLPKQKSSYLKALFALIRNIRNMCLNPTTKLSLVYCYIGGGVNYA